MEGIVKLAAGLVLLAFGLGYLYRPSWILRFNAWGRTVFFNDAYVLFYRRRWGLPLFVLSLLFFYSGFLNLSQHRSQKMVTSSSIDLVPVIEALDAGRHDEAVRLGQEAVRQDPDSRPAQALLRLAADRHRRPSSASPKANIER